MLPSSRNLVIRRGRQLEMVHIDVFVENEVVVSHIGDSLRAQQLYVLIGGGLQVIKVPQRI